MTQSIDNTLEWFTAKDYARWGVKNLTVPVAVTVAADRLSGLNVFNPSEGLIKNLGGVLGNFLWPDRLPRPAEAYSLCQDLKNEIKARKPRDHTSINRFHLSSPQNLSGEARMQAYAHDDPPVSKIIPRYFIMRQAMVVRSKWCGGECNGEWMEVGGRYLFIGTSCIWFLTSRITCIFLLQHNIDFLFQHNVRSY